MKKIYSLLMAIACFMSATAQTDIIEVNNLTISDDNFKDYTGLLGMFQVVGISDDFQAMFTVSSFQMEGSYTNDDMYADYKPSGRGFYHSPGAPGEPGRDYVFSAPEPLFCFGYGLSYTDFKYSDLKIDVHPGEQNGTVEVSCNVTNTGQYDGAEVVQLYVRDLVSSVTTPVRALKGFEKIYLRRGETRRVVMHVAADDLKLWNQEMQFVLEPGEFEVHVGSSSEDIRLQGNFEISTK